MEYKNSGYQFLDSFNMIKQISILALGLFVFGCSSSKKTITFSKNQVIAHRGAWKKKGFPQNSIASLHQAIALKCAGSEFDVRMTADDSLVINHDSVYNSLQIEKTKYQDLLAFKLSNGEKLPTLREYIMAGIKNNSTTRLVCEIKPSDISKERGEIIASRVIQLVQELKAENWMVYISFDFQILKEIIALNPTAKTQYLEANKTPEKLMVEGISGADYYYSDFKAHPEWIKSAKKNHILLNAWTVNEAVEMDWFLSNNFDFITTNEPEMLLEKLK